MVKSETPLEASQLLPRFMTCEEDFDEERYSCQHSYAYESAIGPIRKTSSF
jgi:hypothetical protein